MGDLWEALVQAATLVTSGDPELLRIVALSLAVSLSAVLLATVVGLPLGAVLAVGRFPGRGAVLVVLNALMGLPPVVVGLLVYLLLSRAGPLGALGLLFTPAAMVLAQTVLVLPIVAGLARRTLEDAWVEYAEQLRSLGAGTGRAALTLIRDVRFSLLTIVLAGFGRAAAEVGAVMIVGGNIDGVTRVMTTAIALETSKGDLPLALALGAILIATVMCLNALAHGVGVFAERRHGVNRMLLPLVLDDVEFHAGGKAILTGITARIRAGSRTLILGPNGAGKSVLMRLCHGLLRPTAGRIAWSGDPRPGGAVRGQAMVFQQRPVLLRRSALDNIRYALHLAGVARGPAAVRAREALATVGLDALADRPARVLSGGEQQRLALARAWALRPEVLFLDEPTASLDPHAASAVERIVQAFHTAGTTVVMSTHDLAQARRLADEVMFLNGGRLVEHGPAADFFTAPATGSAARFIRGELTWD